jgi:ribonuclease R
MSRKNNRKSSSGKKKVKQELKQGIRLLFKNDPEGSYNYKQISARLEITDSNTRKLVLSILNELKNENYLNEFTRGIFALNLENVALTGRMDATARGAGYAITDGDEGDIYIHPKNMNRALHGDRVKIDIIGKNRGKSEGRVVEVLDREAKQFVGAISMSKKYAFLITDNPKVSIDLYIPLDKLNGAKDGDKVVGRVTSWPKGVDSPFGEVIEVLGQPLNNDAEMLAILFKNDLESKFPDEVIEAAEKVGIELDDQEIAKRRDMRDTLTFTIDPWDAKDFDDAISFKILDNDRYEVGVHIADVSHYVVPDSPMDKEALKRGNSTYLVDRVIPMLPEQLSNVACSLRPNEDKYTFSAVFEMDDNGKIYKEWFGKTVTHSNHRFTYEEAQEVIEGKSEVLKDEILFLDKVAKTLRKARLGKGALSIESEETRFKLDEKGEPIEVINKVSKDAHKLIEEFMLLANKRVAFHVGFIKGEKASNTNFIYRVHDKPDEGKIQTLAVFLDKFGYDLKFSNLEEVSKKLNGLFAKVRNTPEFSLIQSMAIRSMAKATYDTVNIGHYGLHFEYYTHFTSPIRRYADLMVHRILQNKLLNKQVNYGNKLPEICKHISIQERKSIDAERESTKYFQVKFMKDKVGEVFDGTVSGLADFGMFIRIDENYCEGMVSMGAIPGDVFYFDADHFRIVGRRHKQEYNFGDKVVVQVVGVDTFKKQINMEIVEEHN